MLYRRKTTDLDAAEWLDEASEEENDPLRAADRKADRRWDEEEEELAFYSKRFGLPHEKEHRARRPPRNERQRFEEHRAEVETVAEVAGLESVWDTTYTPTRYEGGFLRESLQPFYSQDQIVDVNALVKGGKEANVYRCRAHTSLGLEWIAAKVYRPRKFRNLRNDAIYREGRHLLTSEDGRPKSVNPRDLRVARAVGKKSLFGVEVRHTSWLMYEYTALQTLHSAGVPVPEPYGVGENAILMAYIGDAGRAAPTLHEVSLEAEEASIVFEQVLESIAVMLENGLVHGDLSAYNILYWRGEMTIIDFPQVVNAHSNYSARSILYRDVARVCRYFARYGIRADASRAAAELWQRHAAPDPDDLAADLSLLEREVDLEEENDEKW